VGDAPKTRTHWAAPTGIPVGTTPALCSLMENCAPIVAPSRAARPEAGFTLVELMIVVTLIGLLAALAIPNMVKARDNSRLNVIYRNLRQLDNAKDIWAIENRKVTGDPVPDLSVLSNYLAGGRIIDVIHEVYIPNPVGTLPGAALPAATALGPYPPGAFIPAP
jgi:prepilin-type N-terminal cleavage/methylation domain-containing protein